MTFLETLQKYGHKSLGYPSKEALDTMYELSPDLDNQMELLLETWFFSVKVPLHHEANPDGTKTFRPLKEPYVRYLQAMVANRYSKSHSVRGIRTVLENLGFNVTSNGQLTNIWNRAETKLLLKDKARSEAKGRAERKAEAAKEGKTKTNPMTDKRKQQLARARSTLKTKREVTALEEELRKAKNKLSRKASLAGKTYSEIKRTPEEKEAARGQLKLTKERFKAEGKTVLYEPTPKQTLFHEAWEDIVLYGGAAGGGKSYAMLIDALRYCMHWDYRALIIRRTSPMLKELISVSRALYPKAFPGAKYNKSENVWTFPSGATIQFGYLDRPEDIENYQGLPYAYIGFDEIQHQRSDENFVYLMSRLRSTNPAIKCYIRASANPGGAPWVKETFIDPADPGTTFYKNGISYKFIPATLADNPYLDTPVGDEVFSPYRKMLMALPEVKRLQLLEGDWMAGEDSMFTFSPDLHVTDEMPPEYWSVLNALDYGYRDPAAALWAAICPRTGQIVIYQELESLGVTHGPWAEAVKDAEGYVPQGVDRVIDHSVFNVTGHSGPGVREILGQYGLHPRPADRNREAGWNQIHQRLLMDPVTEQPGLLVHSSCKLLIEQLITAKCHEKKPDDIDDTRLTSKGRKHHWDLLDALRYLLMARPMRETHQDRAFKHKSSAEGFKRYRGYFQ